MAVTGKRHGKIIAGEKDLAGKGPKNLVLEEKIVMKCADYTCPYWEKDKDCEAAEGCAEYIDKIPCTPEDMKKRGCTEWCGMPFC